MDPGHPLNKSSEPVQSQPQWQNTSAYNPDQIYNAKAIVPPVLKCLLEVEEVRLKEKAFYTGPGQALFYLSPEFECCGPSYNMKLQDSGWRDVVSMRLEPAGCCKTDNCLKVSALPGLTIGFITFSDFSHNMTLSIEMTYGEPAFTAELPSYKSQNSIEILSVNGSCPVASITKEGEKESSEVLIKFPLDMKATLKVLILAAFLYMRYQLNLLYRRRISSFDKGWIKAGGGFIPGVDMGRRTHGGGFLVANWGGGGGF
ncbi:uncharacterized protein [Dendropsophus ebraccatus]|uniref:uncharacterized protein n=1 Tax=Dendropsophus ebraccatus TaxID=150705 RepID=UPI0038322A80